MLAVLLINEHSDSLCRRHCPFRLGDLACLDRAAAPLRRPYTLYGSTGLPHEEQQKLLPFSDWIALKPWGTLSTHTIHDNLSSAETTAMPSFRQRGHLSLLSTLNYY